MFNLPFEAVEDYALTFIQVSHWELKQQGPQSECSDFHERIEPECLLTRLIDRNHDFLKWAHKQPPYLKAIERFSKKKLERSLFFNHYSDGVVMSKKTVLDGILALAFVRYAGVEAFGAEFFLRNPKQDRALMDHAQTLLKLLNSHEITASQISEAFLKTLEHLSKGFVKPGLALGDSKSLININHPKAAREVFILELSTLYKEHFMHCNGTALHRPHVEVIFEMAQLIDPDIDRRVVDNHLSRQQFQSALLDA